MVVDWAPRAAPVGLLKVTVKLSSFSGIVSLMIGTEMVWVTWPAAKVTVPDEAV